MFRRKRTFFFSFCVFLSGIVVGLLIAPSFKTMPRTSLLTPTQTTPSPLPTLVVDSLNNSFQSAIPLKTGYELQDALASNADANYYSFQVAKPVYARFAFKELPYAYSTTIYNTSKQIIASSTRSGFAAVASLVKITTPGTYFLRVTGSSPNAEKIGYTITLTFLPIQ